MKSPSLDDLRVFLAVACEGSLNAAANRLSASPATLSRRINQLEEETGRALFHRSPTGYELTADGESLRERVLVLDAVRNDLEDWLQAPNSKITVKLSAGTWTCKFLVGQIEQLVEDGDEFGLVFVSTEQRLNIAHREIDIGLRNTRPEEPNLAARRVADVHYACYAAGSLKLDKNTPEKWPWVMMTPDCSNTLSTRWMQENHSTQAAVQCTSPRTLLDLVISGAGVTVLPCFVGDQEPQLKRAGSTIEELANAQWLVMHGDTRHRPAVRTILDRVSAVIEANNDLYLGERGLA